MRQVQFTATAALGATAAVKATLNLPLLQSRFFVEECAKGWLFLVATFEDPDDPLVHGYGITAEQAWRVAAKTGGIVPGATLCERILASDPVWRSKTGQTVTLEHLQTLRKD